MHIYSVISITSAVFAFAAGLIIFTKNPRAPLNRTFFLFSAAVTAWLGFAGLVGANCANSSKAVFYDQLVYLSVILVVPTVYHFSVILTKKTKQNALVAISYITAFFFGYTVFGDNFISGLKYYPVGCHTQAEFFHHLFLGYFIFFVVVMYANLFRGLFTNNTGRQSAGKIYSDIISYFRSRLNWLFTRLRNLRASNHKYIRPRFGCNIGIRHNTASFAEHKSYHYGIVRGGYIRSAIA